MNEGVKKAIIEGVGTVTGSFIIAFGVALFLLPNQLSTGGFSGIATIIYYLFNVPMGIMNIVLNIPFFLLSIYKIGREFFWKTIIGTVSLSFFIDVLDKYNSITTDRFLASVYGGIIIGLRNSNNIEIECINRRF